MTRSRPPARIVGFVWLVRAVSAWLVGYPLAQALMGTGLDRYAEGDRLVFEPGGLLLVEALRVGAGSLGAVARSATVVALLVLFLQLIPLGALIASVQDPALRLADCVARGVQALPALTTLTGFAVLGQGLWLLLMGSILGRLVDPTRSVFDERTADVALGCGFLIVLAGLALLGVLLDLARTRVLAARSGGLAAIAPSVELLRRHPIHLLLGWATPATWAIVVAGVAAAATTQLDVSTPGGWRIAAVIAVHQLAAVGWVVLRARWLQTASRLLPAAAET